MIEYRIVTTAGLAGAFHQRAKELRLFGLVWTAVLIGALGAAAYLGLQRTHAISAMLQSGEVGAGVMLIQMVLSLLTVGAPVWLAWLATKQISHIFRLEQDYGFKASFAKAYEGYRAEAVRLDPQFEARLFASALQRLDENPLRLVADNQAGSPLNDFLQQPWLQNLMTSDSSIKNNVIEFLKKHPANDAGSPSAAKASRPEATIAPQPTEKIS